MPYEYDPQPDITVYELALVVGVVINRGDPTKLDSWAQIKRHFRVYKSSKELKEPRFDFTGKTQQLGRWILGKD